MQGVLLRLLVAAVGVGMIVYVVRAIGRGSIVAISRAPAGPYDPKENPFFFWLSACILTAVGGVFIIIALAEES